MGDARSGGAVTELVAFTLTSDGYRDVGLRHWLLCESGSFDIVGARLADGHYSRRKHGSNQFMPPGQRFAMVSRDMLSVWGWWRPHPSAGIDALNGLDGWTCTIFRRTGGPRASDLILDAEVAVGVLGYDCGPSGFITYVWDRKVRGRHKGCCFKAAGWHVAGRCEECGTWRPRSADGQKTLLHKLIMAGRP